jgi:hypothetical protein
MQKFAKGPLCISGLQPILQQSIMVPDQRKQNYTFPRPMHVLTKLNVLNLELHI